MKVWKGELLLFFMRVRCGAVTENKTESTHAEDGCQLVPRPDPVLRKVYECDRCLIVNKPAGLVTHPTKGDVYSSLISRVQYVCGGRNATGDPMHLINRLDRETSGLVVFAKCDVLARELRNAWQSGMVHKSYLALVHGLFPYENWVCQEPIGNDETSLVHIKDGVRADGRPCVTRFRRLATHELTIGPVSIIEARPETGRKHQIRIHLSHLGYPIIGDKIYGLDEGLYLRFVSAALSDQDRELLVLPHHALHAMQLIFPGGLLEVESISCCPDGHFFTLFPDLSHSYKFL